MAPAPAAVGQWPASSFSPTQAGLQGSFGAHTSLLDVTVATAPGPANMIPSKFLIKPFRFQRSDIGQFPPSVPQASGFVTSTTVDQASNLPSPQPKTLPASPKVLAATESLPEMPAWIMHVFAGLASFVLTLAVLLYFTQFPARMIWVRDLKQKLRGYSKVQQEDFEFRERPHGHSSSAAVCNYGEAQARRARKRKPKHHRVNTEVRYSGLGIVLHDEHSGGPATYQRRSCDGETLRLQPDNGSIDQRETLTAPLPSATSIFSNEFTPTQASPTLSEIENGRRRQLVRAPTLEILDNKSLCHTGQYQIEDKGTGSAFLTRVNDGINNTLDSLSRTLHDQVTGPEEGLLLPIHNRKREELWTPGVFVD